MLEIHNLNKEYDGKPLLQQINLTVDKGETLSLLGKSGSGKSTLLRIIAGLETAQSGEILWDKHTLNHQPAHKRNFGLMFQEYALFPHLNVWGNVAFGLKLKNISKIEIDRIVRETLTLVHMDTFANRRVDELSGGEKQRVALARTLATQPRLLMLDEPLAALDRTLRQELLQEVRQVLHQTGIPAIYVTHDQEEAYTIADRMAILMDGRIIQTGSPEEIYRHPVSIEAASFLGLKNELAGVVTGLTPALTVHTEIGTFVLLGEIDPTHAIGLLDPVKCVLRSASINSSASSNQIQATVEDCIFQEAGYQTQVACASLTFSFLLDEAHAHGEKLSLHIPPESINVFPVRKP